MPTESDLKQSSSDDNNSNLGRKPSAGNAM